MSVLKKTAAVLLLLFCLCLTACGQRGKIVQVEGYVLFPDKELVPPEARMDLYVKSNFRGKYG